MADADELVGAWLTRKFRNEGQDEHLRGCPDLAIDWDGGDGTYGCDTGCEYVRLEAALTCPHGHREEFEYGNWGYMSEILRELEAGEDP